MTLTIEGLREMAQEDTYLNSEVSCHGNETNAAVLGLRKRGDISCQKPKQAQHKRPFES